MGRDRWGSGRGGVLFFSTDLIIVSVHCKDYAIPSNKCNFQVKQRGECGHPVCSPLLTHSLGHMLFVGGQLWLVQGLQKGVQ